MTEKVLLYSRSAVLTGRKLGKALGIRATRLHKDIHPDSNVVIRYGHRFGMFSRDTETNSGKVIAICADSLKFFEFCKEAGFYCPEYISPKEYEPEDYPFFLRKRLHYGGKDIKVVEDREQYDEFVEPDSYIVVPSRIKYEIRVHVINHEVVRVFKKVGDPENEDKYPIRTAHKGWKYSLVKPPYGERYVKARLLSVELSRALGLGFGAIDLGLDKDKKQYIIFEVNTAPSLINNENTFEMYLEYFKGLVDV